MTSSITAKWNAAKAAAGTLNSAATATADRNTRIMAIFPFSRLGNHIGVHLPVNAETSARATPGWGRHDGAAPSGSSTSREQGDAQARAAVRDQCHRLTRLLGPRNTLGNRAGHAVFHL